MEKEFLHCRRYWYPFFLLLLLFLFSYCENNVVWLKKCFANSEVFVIFTRDLHLSPILLMHILGVAAYIPCVP